MWGVAVAMSYIFMVNEEWKWYNQTIGIYKGMNYMSKKLPKRYVSEDAVKRTLKIDSFRNLSKDKIMQFASMIPYMDKEVQNLIDWVCLSEQIKENNNTIRSLTGEYKKIEPDCREGVRAQLERMKELCKERNSLYEKQNELKGQKQQIERTLER